MLTQKQSTKPASRPGKPKLTVVRTAPAIPVIIEVRNVKTQMVSGKGCLMPPVNEFNTAYLKEKKHDPL